MVEAEQGRISAQVILRAVSGQLMDAYLTARTLGKYLPPQEAARQAQRSFVQAGFQVGPLVANNFAISASAATFEQFFHTKLHRQEQGGWLCELPSGELQEELPMAALSEEVAQNLAAVTFMPPPVFGPPHYN